MWEVGILCGTVEFRLLETVWGCEGVKLVNPISAALYTYAPPTMLYIGNQMYTVTYDTKYTNAVAR